MTSAGSIKSGGLPKPVGESDLNLLLPTDRSEVDLRSVKVCAPMFEECITDVSTLGKTSRLKNDKILEKKNTIR